MTVTLLLAAALVAVADWVAVGRGLFRLEYLLKPGTLVLLLAAATSADLGPSGVWVLTALALGLVGDVAIMLAESVVEPPPLEPRFVIGLVAFLLGHLAYVVGFTRLGLHVTPALAGLLVAAGVGGLVLPGVLRVAARDGGSSLVGAVAAYALVAAAMAACAAGTQLVLVALGGGLFLVSDALLARQRFAARLPHGPVLVAASYHLAQGLLVIGIMIA